MLKQGIALGMDWTLPVLAGVVVVAAAAQGCLKSNIVMGMWRLRSSQVQVNRETSEGNDLIPQPVLDSHVFCKVLDDVGAVDLDG